MHESGNDYGQAYIDISTGQTLIGGQAYEYHIEAGGHPADLREIGEYINGDEELPRFTDESNTKYKDWTREDFIANGKWILKLCGKFSDRVMSRATRLRLHPNPKAIRAPGRFKDMRDYKESIGAPQNPYANWDLIDAAYYIRNLLVENSEQRPSTKMVARAVAENEDGPAYTTLESLLPIQRAIE